MRLEYFEMIDTVEQMSDDHTSLVCASTVPTVSPVFEGHFPGHAIMPGVLIAETMAQACGYLAVIKNNFEKMAYLSGIESARFRNYVEPGDKMQVKVKEIHEGSGYSVFDCAVFVNANKVANAEIRLKISAFPNDTLRHTMLNRLSRAGLSAKS